MYLFQTNGYSISDEFVDFFIRHDILVSISLDGPREIHDRYRKDVHGLGTYDRVVETITRFKSAGVMFNILSVVTKDVAQHPKEVWDELFSYTSYVQFIPCDEPFFGTPQDYSVTAEQYGQFLIDTFDLFDLAIRSGLKISERRFDNYMSMLNGKVPEDCAMCGKCTVYFTAEADGGIYPCDLYVLDKWRMGNINTVNYLKLRKSEAARTFRAISLNLPQECTSCPWYDRLCLGGCLRDREPVIDGVPSLNRFCKSYKMFFEARHNEMENLAVYLRDHPRVR